MENIPPLSLSVSFPLPFYFSASSSSSPSFASLTSTAALSTIWVRGEKKDTKQKIESAAPALTKWLQMCQCRWHLTSGCEIAHLRSFIRRVETSVQTVEAWMEIITFWNNHLFRFAFAHKFSLLPPCHLLLLHLISSFLFLISSSLPLTLSLSCLSMAMNTESVRDSRCVGSPWRRDKTTHEANSCTQTYAWARKPSVSCRASAHMRTHAGMILMLIKLWQCNFPYQ